MNGLKLAAVALIGACAANGSEFFVAPGGNDAAAGTAAALCAKRGVTPRDLPYPVLRSALAKAGVCLG